MEWDKIKEFGEQSHSPIFTHKANRTSQVGTRPIILHSYSKTKIEKMEQIEAKKFNNEMMTITDEFFKKC